MAKETSWIQYCQSQKQDAIFLGKRKHAHHPNKRHLHSFAFERKEKLFWFFLVFFGFFFNDFGTRFSCFLVHCSFKKRNESEPLSSHYSKRNSFFLVFDQALILLFKTPELHNCILSFNNSYLSGVWIPEVLFQA